MYSQNDMRTDSNYIDLYGTTDSGYTVFIRTSYESIMESARIANKFLVYVGILL